MKDPATDYAEMDFVYPIVTLDRYGEQFRWQLFQLLSFAGGPGQNETERNRFTIFPIYFQQRSSDPTQNYTALFPFYGHLKNRLFRDEISFVMFPIYSETRKGDVVTDNYVYPFFHLRHGEKLNGWQFFPIVGHEHKEITTRTNGFGDVKTIGGHDERFVLWPIYLDAYTGTGTEDEMWTSGVLPLYSLQRSKKRDATTIIWPFFSRVDEHEKKYREYDAPWPLIVFARGEGKYTSRVFPFFSHAHNATIESDWYLWPVYKFNRTHSDPLDRKRTRILLFLYSDASDRNTETGAYRRRVDFWPFYRHQREYNGNTRLQLFAPLEIYVPGSHKIERDYSPVWSVWRSEHNAVTGASSRSLLWNFYRHDKTTNSAFTSAVFGLYQSRKTNAGTSLKFFYVPVKKSG